MLLSQYFIKPFVGVVAETPGGTSSNIPTSTKTNISTAKTEECKKEE